MTGKKDGAPGLEVDFPISLLPRNTVLESVLANGMFSTVYKAVYHIDQTGVAEMPFVVKHIKSSNHPKRVLTEMCLLAKLRGRHNIIPVWSLISTNFSYLVIMPYFTHDSFSSFFRDLTRREVANYIFALIDALAYIHTLNVTHRDIKPTNFLYNRQLKRYALIDFGLAEKESRSFMNSTRSTAGNCEQSGLIPPILQCAVNKSETKSVHVASVPTYDSSQNFINPNVFPCPVIAGMSSCDEIQRPVFDQFAVFEKIPPKLNTADGLMSTMTVPQLFAIGKVNAIKTKSKLSAASIRRRLRFSDVINVAEGTEGQAEVTVQKTSITTDFAVVDTSTKANSEIDALKTCGNGAGTPAMKAGDESGAAACPASLARFKSSDSGYSTASSQQQSSNSGCRCDGPSLICGVCQDAPDIQAQRSGTTGYRAPEVLLRSRSQTTAIDVWAAGVVFLIILSARYPFFTAKIDLEAVCQLMTIFGRRKVAELASELGLLLLLPANCPMSEEAPFTLEKLCRQLRAGVACRQLFGADDGCLSSSTKHENEASDVTTLATSSGNGRKRTLAQSGRSVLRCVGDGAVDDKNNDSSVCNEFTSLAFDLLEKLLEVRPSFRISAEEAMKHKFFEKFCSSGGDDLLS